MPRRKGNRQAGHRGRWSDSYPQKRKNCGSDSSEDSDGPPQSVFVKYDSDNAADTKAEHKYFGAVFSICKSIVSLASTSDGRHLYLAQGQWLIMWGQKRGYLPLLLWSENLELSMRRIKMVKLRLKWFCIMKKLLKPRPVVALGRNIWSEFLMRNGELIRANCELDCNELLVCTCDLNEDFIGGPVMDLEDRILGITFFYKETAPFLPVEIAARCLDYFKKFKEELPWLRIRGHAIHMLDLPVLENMCCKFAKLPSGILVEKICGVSPENCGGIKVGDVISELDGVVLSSVAQWVQEYGDTPGICTKTHGSDYICVKPERMGGFL
ncbi:hypothetical protein SEVIR_1G137700v4 [Setaria viridis]|uniref:PDZ domain-containing protein n=1 Tax=Setaria viridis TaxID=4556 RepID=A0A4U6W9V6_SETVI|nr:uncharacterized protein LOC117850251 isoform X3 [Setaria viridis]TKW38775.1 hypothetical protein SEVIR_1G137700v2 [Setaria viridis]